MSQDGFISKIAYNQYTKQLEAEVLAGPMPKHVGVIMDGNRRYAKEILGTNDTNQGHIKGKDKLREVLEWNFKTKIKTLTVFAFSTENFSRKQDEVDFLMDLISEMMHETANDEITHKHHVRVRMIGDRSIIPEKLLKAVEEVEEKTKGYDDYHLNVAIAYSGRNEILNAVKEIANKVKDGNMKLEDINEEMFSDHLYTKDEPDLDLVIRTSGEVRISNFLIWQLAYSELYFTDVYWPGFRYIDYLRAIREYQHRVRRYGV